MDEHELRLYEVQRDTENCRRNVTRFRRWAEKWEDLHGSPPASALGIRKNGTESKNLDC